MTHKSKLRLPPHLYSVTTLPSKAHIHTANIDARPTFSNVCHSKVYSKQFSGTYSILAYLFTAMLYDDTINVTLCLWVMFSVLNFNGFNSFI